MLYDTLENLERYKTLHPNLALAIELLATVDYSHLQKGRHELSGETVFLMAQENQTVVTENLPYEYHKRYADVHVVLSGQEIIRYGIGDGKEHQSYDETGDFGLSFYEDRQDVVMRPGYFALFLPDEPHCPNIALTDEEQIRKIVLKIAID